MNTKRFVDKVVLVTGGSSGIGLATARAFAGEGAKVVIASRRERLGEEAANQIKSDGGEAHYIKTDVTVPEQIEGLFNKIIEKYDRLDFAFNNAGTAPAVKSFEEATLEEWNNTIAANLRSIYLCMQREITQMLDQKFGVIVNNSAVAGVAAEAGMSVFCASKYAVLGLTKGAALDYAHRNVRINAVCPGFIQTPALEESLKKDKALRELIQSKIPMNRLGRPEEIAGAVLWICSDAASFMTGKEMVIGGGQGVRF